ncbi:MAG: Na/Pi cotransporter family protein [Oscillospiraceae bacterium]|nr:Na/Pi cotransporter family protein [Oscillospiraceae bacterium]
MGIYEVLSLIGGLAMFLFGMKIMGDALEKRAGSQMKTILGKMTSNRLKGFLLGMGVTAIIQSSSATTVMVVGFVNSGIMTLKQSIGVIMGANIGTSVTSWLLALTGIEGDALWVNLLKPTSFTPVLALIGIFLYTFQKNKKRSDTGLILLGFAVLMFGMEMMSDSVSGLKENENFTRILTMFENPILGVLAGAVMTAIIQSSSASVGILQALSATNGITYAAAIPIVMGQNIGTCVTAMISSAGANKNAKRTAVVHLCFNIMATVIILPIYYILNMIFDFSISGVAANELGIAVLHTAFNVGAVVILMPLSGVLEKIAVRLVRDKGEKEKSKLLDERLLATPAVAIERCRVVTTEMAHVAVDAMTMSLDMLSAYDPKVAQKIMDNEEKADKYEDRLGSYLLKISTNSLSEEDSASVTELLHVIGDLERISDHAADLLLSAEEMNDKKLTFSAAANHEVKVLSSAIREILELSLKAFEDNDISAAVMVEPLEQVVDRLEEILKKEHIQRLQKGECSIEMGFILSDILGNIERVSDHCSNIAGYLIETRHGSLDVHKYLRSVKHGDTEFSDYYSYFEAKYSI